MSAETFYQSLSQSKFSAVYIFCGEEDFLIDEALQALVTKVLPGDTENFNLDILSAVETDTREIVARANSFPLMSQYRVVIVKDLDRRGEKSREKEKGNDALLSYLNNPSPTTILVLVVKKLDKELKGKGEFVEFSRLDEGRLRRWIEERGARYGKRVRPEASQALITYVGSSLRALDRELEKISVYVDEKKTIDIDDVNAVVGLSKTYNVFELSRAVGSRDLKRSLEILERMMEFGEHPPLMVAVLTKHFMSLLKNVDKGLRVASYSRAELERSFGFLARADEKLKFTSEDPRSVMTVLFHELMR
jgi:DNA polymerase-3 subunit delta